MTNNYFRVSAPFQRQIYFFDSSNTERLESAFSAAEATALAFFDNMRRAVKPRIDIYKRIPAPGPWNNLDQISA